MSKTTQNSTPIKKIANQSHPKDNTERCAYNAYMRRDEMDDATIERWIELLDEWSFTCNKKDYTLGGFLRANKIKDRTFRNVCKRNKKLKAAKEDALESLVDHNYSRACANDANWNAIKFGLVRFNKYYKKADLEYERELAEIKKDADKKEDTNITVNLVDHMGNKKEVTSHE